MTAEEAHVILAARNVYWALAKHDVRLTLTPAQRASVAELAKAVARLDIAEREAAWAKQLGPLPPAPTKRTSGVMKLRLVK
jgi:hypothetical protein